MIYLQAFLVCGVICAIGQIILDNTKLTPGHLNTVFVIIGILLAAFGVYDNLIELGGIGATLPITNFGYVLYEGAISGLEINGIIGLLSGILAGASAVLAGTIIISFFVAVIFKPRN